MTLEPVPAGRTVAVLGLGYVGCVTAACLADVGHTVVGVDRDEYKVNSVRAGLAPFHEPGLEPLLRKNVAAGRLSASTSLPEAIAAAEIVLICVGTPSERNGNICLDQLKRVAAEIGEARSPQDPPLVVAVRSTVFPGTCEEIVLPAVTSHGRASVVSNPEFLREGTAVRDFFEPSLLVVGGSDPDAVQSVADLYKPLGVSACKVSLRTAEMIKYACNAFHAVKICFANEIGALSERLGVPAGEVMRTLCQDTRLNASAAYLKPGFAFGGSCLPKDLRALVHRAGRLDLELALLESVLPSNNLHLRRHLQLVLDLPPRRIGIFGLAFKEDTDDLRESPAITLIEQLLGKGREVRIFDPHIQFEQIYGSNRAFAVNAIPHISRLLCRSRQEFLDWAEQIVLTQQPSPDDWKALAAVNRPLLDLTGTSHRAAAAAAAGA